MEDVENAMILLYDLCRLCLDEPGVTNIFKPIDWSHDILTYTGVQVNISDKFPQSICSSCRDIISCVKILKDIATKNNKRLWLIQGDNDNQVLRTDSRTHLVFITPCTACDSQIESSEVNEISNNWKESFKNKIVFENEDEVVGESNCQTEKQSGQKNSSTSEDLHIESSEVNEISNNWKESFKNKIVFENEDEVVGGSNCQTEKQSGQKNSSTSEDLHTSSTKKIEESPTSLPSHKEDPEKASTKKRKQSPTSTSGNSPEQVVTFCRKNKKLIDIKQETPAKRSNQSPTSTSDNPKIVTIGKIKIKVDEFEYKCETCNKNYATPKKLYLHQLAHNKKYYCPLDACSKKFATKGDLQKHTRSHTGEKPYKCDICDKSFTQNVTLKSHKKKHNE